MSQTTSIGSFLWRLPFFLAVWAVVIAIKFTVVILGFVMVAILYRWRKVPFDQVPGIFTPWKNPEDWNDKPMGTEESVPKWWIKRRGGLTFWDWYKYHAIRNPANGLRNYSLFVIDYDKSPRLQFLHTGYRKGWGMWTGIHHYPEQRTWGYLCWYNWQLGVLFMHRWNDERHFEFKLGWRITPTDKVDGLPETSVRRKVGSGFASKLLPWREST